MTATADPPEVQTRSLAARVLEVVRAVGVVEKDKRNSFHKYDYASIEGIVDAVHDDLIEQGILWLGGARDYSDRERQTREGVSVVTTVEVVFEFIDVHTGERFEIPWYGRGDDPADKGMAKALTDARKTFIVQQLNLRRGDDTEGDDATDQRYANTGGGVNMTELAKGLKDAELNEVLVAAGYPASQKPWGFFVKVPPEHAERIRELLQARRR